VEVMMNSWVMVVVCVALYCPFPLAGGRFGWGWER
jgi:hypothetical protein